MQSVINKNANSVVVYNFQFQQVFTHTHKANITPKLDSGVTLNKILDVLENRTLISKV